MEFEEKEDENEVGDVGQGASLEPVGVPQVVQVVQSAKEKAAIDGHHHPLDGGHRGSAGGPQFSLRTPKVLSENQEAEPQDWAGETGGVGDREVGGDHPPVHPPPVHQPGEGGARVAWGRRAVNGELVARQVAHVGGVAGPGGQPGDDGQPLGKDHHDEGAGGR